MGPVGPALHGTLGLSPKRRCRPPGMPKMMHSQVLSAGFTDADSWVGGRAHTHNRDGTPLAATDGVVARGPSWYGSMPPHPFPIPAPVPAVAGGSRGG